MSSIRHKREHVKNKSEKVIQQEALPKEPFTEDAFHEAWNAYIALVTKRGEKILASTLETDVPKLVDTTINLTFPNETMKVELERAQHGLMEFLRKQLNNFDISLQINVNEKQTKKYVFDSKDKYKRLREINPVIDLLRQEFDLDI